MQMSRWLPLVFGMLLVGSANGCGAQAARPSAVATTPASEPAQSAPPKGAAEQAATTAPAAIAGPIAHTTSADAGAPKAARAEQAIAQPRESKERPGLATQFGEDLRREARHTEFERESMTAPFVTTTIWYNDAPGAEALVNHAATRSGNRAERELLNGGLVVGITDEWFQVLPGFTADNRCYAIGEANARYAIRITNRTDFAFEVVASVDGLHVIDGRPASYDRRGYVLGPRDTMTIEGFRTSEATIAAFRFGKVSESYAVQMGQSDRNVGVIGVAFFQERGRTPVYPSEDSRLRRDADPFPGEYAPRPKAR